MNLKYYTRFYLVSARKSILSKLEYKKDLIIGILGFFLENISSILAIYYTVGSIPSIKGWTFYELGFLYGFSMIPIGLDHMFCDELWRIAYFKVKNGFIDRYFLRPLSILFQIIAEKIQLESLGELIIGIVMMSLCGSKCNIQWNFQLVLILIESAVFGAVIITCIKVITSAFAFIFKKSGLVTQIFYNFNAYAKYPVNIYPKIFRFLIVFLVPFGLFISLPVELVLFNSFSAVILSLMIISITAVFVIISAIVWSFCVKRYESTGN